MSQIAVRTRLAPEARAQQILDAASLMVVEQGAFPLSLEVLAERLGISKALIYSYFPTQYDIGNALLQRRLDALDRQGIAAASALPDWRDAAIACADIYQQETATNGPLLHVLLSDLYLSRRLAPMLLARYRRIMGRLARRIRTISRLPAAEAVSALTVVSAIAEEAGSLSNSGRIDADLAREIARAMTIGAIENLCATSAPRLPTGEQPSPATPNARHPWSRAPAGR
jgi:AcrR family transcriptional regulator